MSTHKQKDMLEKDSVLHASLVDRGQLIGEVKQNNETLIKVQT